MGTGALLFGAAQVLVAAMLLYRNQSGGEAVEVEIGGQTVTLYASIVLLLDGLFWAFVGAGIITLPFLPNF